MKWTMKDGTQIEISQMTTSHIKNCLKMLERGRFNKEIYDELVKELRSRGEPFMTAYIEDSEVIKQGMFEREW